MAETIKKGDIATVQAGEGTLVDVTKYGVAKYFDDDAFQELTKTSFIPRLQLCGGNSEAVKEGKIPIKHYALATTKDDLRDLGETVDVIPLALRMCAVRIAGDQVTSYYDHNSPEFKQVIVDSEQPDSRCMYGPQFLLWVPAVGEFCTFLFGNKSTRREARNLRPLMGKGATLKTKFIKTAKYSWHVPIVVACNSQLSVPNQERMDKTIQVFNNPGANNVEFNPEEMEAGKDDDADDGTNPAAYKPPTTANQGTAKTPTGGTKRTR